MCQCSNCNRRISIFIIMMMNTKLPPSWRHSAAVDWLAFTTQLHQATPTGDIAIWLLHSVCRNRISACRGRTYVVVDHGFLLVVINPPCTKETRSDHEPILVVPNTCKSGPFASTANKLSATFEITFKQTKNSTAETVWHVVSTKQHSVVDRVKGCRQIQQCQCQDGKVTAVNRS